jgi:hypothetical protein
LRWRERATAALGQRSASFLSLSLKSIKTLESDRLLHLSITISVVYSPKGNADLKSFKVFPELWHEHWFL